MLIILLALTAPIALAEYAYSGRPTISAVLLLAIVLKMQADRAASLFLKYGETGRPPLAPWEEALLDEEEEKGAFVRPEERVATEEEIPVEPLGTRPRSRHYESYTRPERAAENPGLPLLEKPREPKAPKQAKAPKAPAPPTPEVSKEPFRMPRFQGKPHEVLGIEEDSSTRQILQAFRHWIKRNHPDVAQGEAAKESATEKARRLTEAKESLLSERKRASARRAA